MSSPGDGPDALDWAETGELAVEEVRDVFLAMAKALRAVQLYDARNPAYHRFLDAVAQSFRRVWEEMGADRLQILVQEDRLLWMGEEVYRNETRSESLSFLLYRDGIRDLTFQRGIEEEELPRFVGAIARARAQAQAGEGEDLVTILWDLDLRFLSHTAVDMGIEGLGLPEGEAEPRSDPGVARAAEELRDPFDLSTIPAAEGRSDAPEGAGEGGAGAPPSGVVRTEDFNPTLYALDPAERTRVREAVRAEMERDLRMDVVHALLDALEEAPGEDRQLQVIEVLGTILPNFLGRGALAPAARLVSDLRTVRARGDGLAPAAAEAADALLDELSSPAVVRELLRALADGAVAPDAPELDALLRALGPAALEPLLLGAGGSLDPRGRAALRQAMRGIAEAHRSAVVSLLDAADPEVVRGAVHLAGELGLEEAAGPMARLLDQGPLEVRRAAVEAAGTLRSPVLAGALLRVLDDGDRDLRVAAVRVLAAMRYPPAVREIRRILEGKGFRGTDISEKVAFFEAYGSLGRDEAVAFLGGLLNGKGFLGRREPTDIRAGAATGLGRVGSAAAAAALERARTDEDPVVRSAVGRALRAEGDAS